MEKAREFQKNMYFCFTDYTKTFYYVGLNKLWKILKHMGIPDHLTCLLRNLQQVEPYMEKLTGSKLGKEIDDAAYCQPAYLTSRQSASYKMRRWMTLKLE